MDPFVRLRVSLLFLFLLLATGGIGYHLLEGMGPLESFYMTVITLSTVGFQEVRPLSPAGRLFTIGLIFGGAGFLLWFLSGSAELLLSEQLWHTLRRQKMKSLIAKFRDHYIICGYGRMGSQVAADFQSHQMPFVVVERNPHLCQHLLEQGLPFVEGDSTSDEVLIQAGVERARGLVAVVNTDADNLMTVVSARALNPSLHIVTRAAAEEAEKKLKRAGVSQVVSPYLLGGRHISLAILHPAVCQLVHTILTDEKIQKRMFEVLVEKESPWVGKTLQEVGQVQRPKGEVLALFRQDQHFLLPPPGTLVQPGDIILFMKSEEIDGGLRG